MLYQSLIGILLAAAQPIDNDAAFRKHIEPILVGRCLECHGDARKGGLDLRNGATALAGGENGPVLQPGDPTASKLYQYVNEGEMPPKHPLDDVTIETLRQWIADGAYYPAEPVDPFAITTETRAGYDWWSLQPIAEVDPPNNEGAPESWSQHPIDRFVYRTLRDNGFEPSPPASPRVLIRRVTYDLTGLPPTPDEIDTFLAECEAETGSHETVGDGAYARLVDRLLASPQYGERWGRHWLDIVRFGESTGYEVNHIVATLWPYRDYVIRSFNDDKPFDRFVREQLAGDALDYGNPDVEIGMAFLAAGPHDIVGNQDPAQAAQIRANSIDEMIRATSDSFLGLTVGCARCHDHKFDPIAQQDYYRLYATFAGVYPDDRAIATEQARNDRETQLKPLREQRDAIAAERRTIYDAFLARAESNAAEYEARWTRPKIARTGTEEIFAPMNALYVRLSVEGSDINPNARTNYRIDEFEVWTAGKSPRNVALASNGATAEGASRKAEDFDAYGADVTIDGKFGEKWLAQSPELTITFAKTETIDRVYFSSDRTNALGDFREAEFVSEYRIHVSPDGEHWIEVASSHDRAPVNDAHRRKRLFDLEVTADERAQLAALDKRLAEADAQMRAVPNFPVYRVGRLEQPEGPFHVFEGGDPMRQGDEVIPASPRVLARVMDGYELDSAAAERERRLALAEWIVAPENPLTPRVLANRLWHYHFGAGLVATPSDFGFMGGAPSHPELLDWLARELITPSDPQAQPWRLKRMHRLILLSQTYRQSGAYREKAAEADQFARLLWRFPPRRLSAEEIRDTMLHVAGKLDTTMGGPGFRLYRYLRDNVSTYVPRDEHGPETYRRAVYHQNVRASRIDLITDYDAPDCALPAPDRVTTTSPLQALTHMNHAFTLDMATALAERLESERATSEERIARAFELAFGRRPTNTENVASQILIESHGLRAFCRGIFNANEFVYIE